MSTPGPEIHLRSHLSAPRLGPQDDRHPNGHSLDAPALSNGSLVCAWITRLRSYLSPNRDNFRESRTASLPDGGRCTRSPSPLRNDPRSIVRARGARRSSP